MSGNNLPPLQVGKTYDVSEFQSFEFRAGHPPAGTTPMLRLHLKNATILETPSSAQELQRLMRVLMSAYPQEAIAFAKSRGWA